MTAIRKQLARALHRKDEAPAIAFAQRVASPSDGVPVSGHIASIQSRPTLPDDRRSASLQSLRSAQSQDSAKSQCARGHHLRIDDVLG